MRHFVLLGTVVIRYHRRLMQRKWMQKGSRLLLRQAMMSFLLLLQPLDYHRFLILTPLLVVVALGWVHRNHFEPGTELSVDGSPATVMASFEEE